VGKRQVQSGPTLKTRAKGPTRLKKCWFQHSRCSLTHREKTRVSAFLYLFISFPSRQDESNIMITSTSLYLNGAARINQCHSYTDRSYNLFLAILHGPFVNLTFPLPAPWASWPFPQMIGFYEISCAEGESVFCQRLSACLDDPKRFKLEYLRAPARCS